ncbi:MAG: hypothetical protein AAFQ87_17180 [Bacteroidota bacterium]
MLSRFLLFLIFASSITVTFAQRPSKRLFNKTRAVDSLALVVYEDSMRMVLRDSINAMLFHDSFVDNRNVWPVQATDEVVSIIEDGRYQMRNKSAKGGSFLTRQMPMMATDQPFYVEVALTHDSGPKNMGYGLVWGLSPDRKTYYALLISANRQYTILEVRDGKFRDIKRWTESKLVLASGKTNLLGIRLSGDLLEFYLNGRMIFKTRYAPTGGNRSGVVLYGKQKVDAEHFFLRDPMAWPKVSR